MTTITTGSKETVDLDFLADFVRVGYGNIGKGRRTVPSAGDLQPLHLYAVYPSSQPGLFDLAGYDDIRDRFDLLGGLPYESVERWFLDDDLVRDVLSGGGGIVIICVDLRRISAKYGARALRYALMEVGAVMQNHYLLAAERGIGVRALGGFLDRTVARNLELPPSSFASLLILVHPNAVLA